MATELTTLVHQQMRLIDRTLTPEDTGLWVEEIDDVLPGPANPIDLPRLKASFRQVRVGRAARAKAGGFVGTVTVDDIVAAYREITPAASWGSCEHCDQGVMSRHTDEGWVASICSCEHGDLRMAQQPGRWGA